jgi:hypothetical protein
MVMLRPIGFSIYIYICSQLRVVQSWTCGKSSEVTTVQVRECLYMAVNERVSADSG